MSLIGYTHRVDFFEGSTELLFDVNKEVKGQFVGVEKEGARQLLKSF